MAHTDKAAKYDRQLRLWAANGQAALESSRIALISGNATGSETLKNLILPGIGSYTVIDEHQVRAQDTGSNFFLDLDCIGSSRAQKVCEYLQELNSDVVGQYLEGSPEKLIHEDPSYFTRKFDLVIVADLPRDSLLQLSKVLWAAKIPLVIVRTIGFMGYLRVALPEHTIIESHPDSMVDLRLDVPWPNLSGFAASMDLERMNDNEHTHVPYILLLLIYLEQWKSENGGVAPSSFQEKTQFQAMIRKGMRNVDEDNFDEAVNNVWRACGKTSVPSDVKAVFQSNQAQSLTERSSDFWFLARSVSDFVEAEGNGLLPLSGTVPDMKSDTNRYVTLQNIYRMKAMSDVAAVKGHLIRHLEMHGKSITAISDQDIETFCKHAGYIKVIKYRSFEEEFKSPNQSTLRNAMSEPDSLIFWYLAKQAADIYESETLTFPGQDSSCSITEVDQARVKLESYLASLPVSRDLLNDDNRAPLENVCAEITRSGRGELHNIASLIGGMAAQEIIKIITRQYVPINNTVIFDGIRSTTAVFEL